MGRIVTLRLTEGLSQELRRQGEQAYPAECCGLLAGRPGDIKKVVQLIPVANRRTDDPHRYLISPDDLRRIEAELRPSGLEDLGCYHSHPEHPAVPSPFHV